MKGAKIFSAFWLILALVFFVGSFFLVPVEEITMTSPAGYPIFISGVCLVFAGLVYGKTGRGTEEQVPEKQVLDPVVLHMMGMLVLYVAGIFLVHYVAATLLFLFAALFYLRREDWRNALMISYISTFMILLVFKYLFSVIMP